ncbi:hypothetical protein FBY40_0782 [Microbacterium sp. SLBN-154]|nr:hypothetical protein FBY40_0782 [Microbacterium sp. SLBN-154]
MDPRLDHDRVLRHDSDLEEVLELLLDRALNPRQMWLLFLDADGRLTGPIMPCDDYPLDPFRLDEIDDLGLLPCAEILAVWIGGLIAAIDAAQAVIVWERRGPREFTDDERAWAGAMAVECGAEGVGLRAQFVLHDDGIRQLTADDHLV